MRRQAYNGFIRKYGYRNFIHFIANSYSVKFLIGLYVVAVAQIALIYSKTNNHWEVK